MEPRAAICTANGARMAISFHTIILLPANLLRKMISGARLYYLQKCTDQKNRNDKDFYQALDDEEMTELKFKVAPYVEKCAIR